MALVVVNSGTPGSDTCYTPSIPTTATNEVAHPRVTMSLGGSKPRSCGPEILSRGSRRRAGLVPSHPFPPALCSSKGDLWFTGFSLDVTLMTPGLAMWDPFSLFVEHHGARRIGCADLTQPFLTGRQDSRGSRKSLEGIDTGPCGALTSSLSIRFEEGTKPKMTFRPHWA